MMRMLKNILVLSLIVACGSPKPVVLEKPTEIDQKELATLEQRLEESVPEGEVSGLEEDSAQCQAFASALLVGYTFEERQILGPYLWLYCMVRLGYTAEDLGL